MSRRWYRARNAVAVGMIATLLMCSTPSRSLAQAGICKEPNDEPGSACELTIGTAIQSTIDRPGDVDLFRFVIGGAGGRVTLELSDLPADYDLYLIDTNGGVLGQSVREGTSTEGLILTLPAGTYFAVVQADPGRDVDTTRPYTLKVTSEAATAAPREPASAGAPTSPQASTSGAATVSAMPAPMSQRLDRPVLLEDNFDDPEKAVLPPTPGTARVYELAYVEGEYSIRNIDQRPANIYIGVLFGDGLDNGTVAVDIRIVGDTAGRAVAVMCRRLPVLNEENQITAYRLVITPDSRQFELQRFDKTMRFSLSGVRPSQAINGGNDWNHLELSCVGSTISASINGQQVASAEDATYSTGHYAIGITGPAAARPRGEMRLDNLVVYGP